MTYYIAREGKPFGPFSIEQLKMQNVTPDTLLWNESMKDWTRAGDIPELQAAIFGGAQPVSDVPNGGYVACNQMPQTAPQAPMEPVCPKTWMAESILVTLFCCLPFGIVAIVKASGVSSAFSRGDFRGAYQASKEAGKWVKLGFFIGLAAILLYVLFVVILGVGAASMSGLGNY